MLPIRPCDADDFRQMRSIINEAALATWAIRFYERNGFELTSDTEKNQLLN